MAESFAGEVRSTGGAAEAAELVPGLLLPGDLVLVKGSRAVGLELVCRALGAAEGVDPEAEPSGARR
jgi:UDP-N-acetylmuramyl pentapeptide synthase